MATTTDPYTLALSRRTAVLAAIAPDLDASPGSDLYDELQADASGSAMVLSSLQSVQQQAFASTATGSYLDGHAADAGVQRQAATFAQITITVAGAAGAPAGGWVVPALTHVWTDADATGTSVYFATNAQATVQANSTATIACTATAAGSGGNIAADGIPTTNMDSTPGVTLQGNTAPSVPAVDQESDSSLRGRIATARAVLYSQAAVQGAALGVAGCAFASLSDPKDGSGHSTTYAAAADGTLSTTLQTAVQAAVNAVLPITETSTVAAFPVVYAVVDLSIDVATGYDQTVTSNAIITAALAYALTLAAGQTISPGPMWAYIVGTAGVAGLADYYTTSPVPPPSVSATQLFRFLAPPSGVTTSTSTTGGSLSNGTVYLGSTYLTSAGETLMTTETALVLSGGTSTQSITITAPATLPYGVTQLKVYASTASGAERLQGDIPVAGGSYTISTVSTGGAAPPSSGTISAPTVTIVSI